MIAFYDNSDPLGNQFYTKYANKMISVTATCNGVTKTFSALIADTCGNGDCASCCARNSDPDTGFLVDMDYYTVINNFGTESCAHGFVQFSIDLNQAPVEKNCGPGIGFCNGLRCCGPDGICGSGPDYCSAANCQVGYGFCQSTQNSCGPNGNICQNRTCCSQYGYCGNDSQYCGYGCKLENGRCDNQPSLAPVWYPTLAPTSISHFLRNQAATEHHRIGGRIYNMSSSSLS